jgi:2-polyprenyl-3-methyl-5-hydroxy-6-metoxy-1,4-benzoquinol methylase/glycosyltransferase involved in cell wall biosynthesis
MAESTCAEGLESARRLADSGRHAEALATIRRYLAEAPDDGEALNDAGAILYATGQLDEAAAHLKRAADRLGDKSGQALWNLAEVYLAAGRPADAVAQFDGLAGAGLMTADLANRAAIALLDRADAAGAVEAIIHSFRASPRQEGLRPIYERVRSLRPKVAFFADFPDLKFIKDIYEHINLRFEVRWFRGRTPHEFEELLRWCDVAWMEWCTNQVVVASHMPKTCRTMVRLHRFEAFCEWPEKVKWENIDALITVGNSAVLERLRQKVPGLEKRTRVVEVPNGVNLERFSFRSRPRGKNLACVGYISLHKNPMLLLQCFRTLHAVDHDYRLFFAGNFQDDGTLEAYLRTMVQEMGLHGAVSFDGWQDDVAGYLEDKHYLVTASIVEGHPVGVLEAMARGIRPVVHMFPGCRDFFPPEYLWSTVNEFCRRILEEPYRPEEYRDFVASRFSLKAQLDRINELFLGFERDPFGKPPAGAAKPPDAATSDARYYDRRWKDQPAGENPLERARREAVVGAVADIGRKDLKILDLGCGRGILAPHLAEFGHVTGVDWSEEGVACARRLCPAGTFIGGGFFDADLPPAAFDAVTSVEVIEHLESADQHRYMALARDLLAPGGTLVMTTPNRPAVARLNEDYRRANGVPWSNQPIENWLTVAELTAMAEGAGLRVVSAKTFVECGNYTDLHIFLVAKNAGAARREGGADG